MQNSFIMSKKILAFAGSLREQSFNKRVVKVAAEGARNAGATVDFIDLRDYPMPIYDADIQDNDGFDENALKFQRLLAGYDAFIIASPEYNGSLSAALKNALDWASRPSDEFKMGEVFGGKFAAIITASPGAFGGLRSLGHLRSILSVLGLHVLPTEIAVGKVHEMFDGDVMTDERMKSFLEKLGASLVASLGS